MSEVWVSEDGCNDKSEARGAGGAVSAVSWVREDIQDG